VNIVNSVVQGVTLGGLYALFACGLSLMVGVMRIINLAHGDLAVLGAFVVWWVHQQFGLNPWVALIVVVPLMVGVGYALQRTMLQRSLSGGPYVPLLATFGLAIVLQNAMLQTFSPDVRSLAPGIGSFATDSWRIGGSLSVPALGVLVLLTAVVVLSGLQLFLQRTTLGLKMRATAQDADTVQLVGVDSRRVYAIATAIAVGTAALAGAFFGLRSTFDAASGPAQLIFGFEAVVIGGFGSLWGTLIGGIVLGVAQSLGSLVDPQFALIAGHLVFLAVLASPRGGLLAGREAAI
jgi:branched-chain amino acid transport system permease protein